MRVAVSGYEANIKNRVGSNQYAFELLKAIHQVDKKNEYRIFLPTPPLPALPPERKNWRYEIVGPPKLWNIFGLPRALFQQPKPDVFFNPGHYSPLFFPVPLVVSIMDLGYLRFPKQFTKPILFKLKFWTSLSIKRASHIFAISESTKNDIIKYCGVDSNKITVTYPGYDKNNFQFPISKSQIGKVKGKYKIKGDYILFLGTLKPSKNLEGLLEAFKRITSHLSPITLVIAGRKGWLYARIFAKAKKLDLKKRVIFTGFIEEKDVPTLMAGAKVFVLPSFWEGFGIPVIEAMACGTPVVVSNAGSLPEIVGEAGIIVNPYDPEEIASGIKKVLDNQSIHDNLQKKGLAQAEKFSWEKCAQKTIKILKNWR